ncbi:hypothetical protein ACF0H5_023082 [Mactra antiquata]
MDTDNPIVTTASAVIPDDKAQVISSHQTRETDDETRDSGYKRSSSPEVKSQEVDDGVLLEGNDARFSKIPFSEPLDNVKGEIPTTSLLGSGLLSPGTRNVPHGGVESSTESYNEKLLRSGAWPLAEGNDKITHSSNITSPVQNLMNSDDKSETDFPLEEEQPEAEEGFSLRKLSRDQLIVITATSFTNLLSFLSLSVLAPFFPLEAEHKNVNNTISGWIFGVFALVQFLTSPFFGRLLPIVGSKFMYLSGLFVCGGCTFLFGILDKVDTSEDITLFVTLCFATRILLALGCTGLSNAGFVLLVKHFPDNVATVFGIGEIFTGVGMVTGPALGGFLYSAGGFILPFAVIGGCCFFALPIVWFFIPKQDDSTQADEEGLSIRAVLLHPRSIVNSIVVVVAASVWAVLDPTLEPHLRVYGLEPEMVGLLFLIMAAFYSLTSPVWGHIADKLPDNRTLLIPGLVICAAGLLLAGPSPALGFKLSFNELWLTIISLIVLGIGSSMSVIPTYDIYIDVLGDLGYPEDTRTYGMVSGLWVSMYALGDFAGPSLGGFLFEEIGFEWLMTWVASVCVLTSILVCITWFIEVKCCKKPSQYLDEKTALLSKGIESYSTAC